MSKQPHHLHLTINWSGSSLPYKALFNFQDHVMLLSASCLDKSSKCTDLPLDLKGNYRHGQKLQPHCDASDETV